MTLPPKVVQPPSESADTFVPQRPRGRYVIFGRGFATGIVFIPASSAPAAAGANSSRGGRGGRILRGVEVSKIGRWFLAALLLGYFFFDVCGQKPAPLPAADLVSKTTDAPVVPFDALASFPCPIPADVESFSAPAVPPAVLALSGTRAAVCGYVLPREMDGDRVRSFLLCRQPPSCCFGGAVQANELIDVTLPPGAERDLPTHLPVVIEGILRVREPKAFEDLLLGLYAIDEPRVAAVDPR